MTGCKQDRPDRGKAAARARGAAPAKRSTWPAATGGGGGQGMNTISPETADTFHLLSARAPGRQPARGARNARLISRGCGQLPHPAAQHAFRKIQIKGGLCHRQSSIRHQPDSLRLELTVGLLSSHIHAPVLRVTICLRFRETGSSSTRLSTAERGRSALRNIPAPFRFCP